MVPSVRMMVPVTVAAEAVTCNNGAWTHRHRSPQYTRKNAHTHTNIPIFSCIQTHMHDIHTHTLALLLAHTHRETIDTDNVCHLLPLLGS